MAEYNRDNMYENSRQRDLVLAANEFCYLRNNTNGVIKTYTGPITMTISAQETLVIFDEKSKQFVETNDFESAKHLLVAPPENWYAVLKNPAINNAHPESGKASISAELEVGRKINIPGPCTFSLFPGQMVKIIKGHHLHLNQYLLARVYDCKAAQNSVAVMIDAEGREIKSTEQYHAGQLLIIKGTEVSFYIPPTGIEIIAIENDPHKGYIRDAITLERLEYCILKDEDGNKTYKYGPAVVFPKPTETFVSSPKGGYVFRAIELSKITGIYVKVIADYYDVEGDESTYHPIGEELFITGDDQMIYYPRPEHAIINYDNKITHHAIAIPEGEGRYIMNRLTGEFKTVKGPAMYLPDPRTEVVVLRKLTEKQCRLWYPNNIAVSNYNAGLNEKIVEKSLKNNVAEIDSLTCYSTAGSLTSTLANLEAKANISRGTSYTKPRTITLDNKFDGVVSIDIWTGYAVSIISKNGERKTVVGPQTILLDYDQTLEVMQLSSGTPKTVNSIEETVYFKYKDNIISDIVAAETKDFVPVKIRIYYSVDFNREYEDKWFNINNYTKYLCDNLRIKIKDAVKNYGIEEFYSNYDTIIKCTINPEGSAVFFEENGMTVNNCEVHSIEVSDDIDKIMRKAQKENITLSIELKEAQNRVILAEERAKAEKKEQELRTEELLNKLALQKREADEKLEMQSAIARRKEEEERAVEQARVDLQELIDIAHACELEREKKEHEQNIDFERQRAEIEKAKQIAYAETVNKIMSSISPSLVAAMNSKSNAEMTSAIAQSLAPYALASGESTADVVNKLLRGTSLENVISGVNLDIK